MIKIYIDKKQITPDEIKKWEQKRIKSSNKTLSKKLNKEIKAETPNELAQIKYQIPLEEMRKILASQIKLSNRIINTAMKLSSSYKESIIEIDTDICNSKEFLGLFYDLIINNREENMKNLLESNPDHYLLQGINENTQESIEVLGEMPIVSQIFIEYHETQLELDDEYPYKVTGTAYLKNHLKIGNFTSQLRNTSEGCHIKVSVEFPNITPSKYIKNHENHLACEFYNSLKIIEKKIENKK